MITLLKGLLTGGFSFLNKWREQKAEESIIELQTNKKIVETNQQIKYEKATSDTRNTSERIAQMAKSWKDEFTMIVFYTPFITNMISPFIDLYMAIQVDSYKRGMLAQASKDAIESLNSFPLWYVLVVVLMTLWSWGASKEVISQFLTMLSWKKK